MAMAAAIAVLNDLQHGLQQIFCQQFFQLLDPVG